MNNMKDPERSYNLSSLVTVLNKKYESLVSKDNEDRLNTINDYFIEIEKFLEKRRLEMWDIQEDFLYREGNVSSKMSDWLELFE